MITSLFLMFVAFGILIGSLIVGFGSIGVIFTTIAGVFVMALVATCYLLGRRTTS